MEGELTGQVALVTGGARGIGAAVARALGVRGARVAIAALHPESAEAGRGALAASGMEVIALTGDVRDPHQARAVVASTAEHFGRLDFLVNGAGLFRRAPSLEVTPAEWQQVLDINLSGPFYMAQAAARVMIPAGGGHILNITSLWGTLAGNGRAAYCAAKAGLAALTRVLAAEWAPHGVRVNAVAPGYVRTSALEKVLVSGKLNLDEVTRRTPAGRLAAPEEVGEFCARLLAGKDNFLTGVVIPLDGGLTGWAGPI